MVATSIRYGQLYEFDAENETVTAYLERAELYFDANDVADEKKVPVLLSNIGTKTYGLLRSLVAPKAPKEKTLAEIKTLLKNHFEPTPSVIAERYRFHRREQAPGESIASYVAELRQLTVHCKFEDTTDFLEESLRDRFVCGLRSAESTRKRLFQEKTLTFAKAMELAQSHETASKDAQMKATEHLPSGNSAVHKVTSPPKKEACYRCGLTIVVSRRPPVTLVAKRDTSKEPVRVANSGKQFQRKGRNGATPRGKERTKWVVKDQSDEDSDSSVGVYMVGKSSTKPIRVEVRINGKPLTTILNPQKGIPSLAAARLQRWAAYRYEIEFKCTQDHGNADGLSRLPLPNVKSPKLNAADVFTVAQLDSLPVTAEQLGKATRTDPILSKVRRFTKSGWPHQVKECLKPYWYRDYCGRRLPVMGHQLE